MIRLFLRTLYLLMFLLTVVNAQDLYICESYTESGTPVGPLNRLEIKPYGTAVYILFDNENKINDPLLYLFVDKLVDNKFTPYDSKTINIQKSDTWAVTSFEFKEPGIYEVYFLNSSHNRLAKNKIETFFSGNFSNQFVSPTLNINLNPKFIFCELVINGKPINPFSTLSLSASNGEAFIYINNKLPFDVEVLKVQYWKRSITNENYEELVDSKKYKILPKWEDTFFKYNFTQIGQFKIDVFDLNDNLITSNIITITK